jgi:6-phosphofructokinase
MGIYAVHQLKKGIKNFAVCWRHHELISIDIDHAVKLPAKQNNLENIKIITKLAAV